MAGLVPSKNKTGETKGNANKGNAMAPARDVSHIMRRMQNDFDRLFDRYSRNFPASWSDFGGGWRWGLDIEDKDDNVIVRAEAPGFEAGDFDIQVDDNRLVLKASRKSESKNEEGEYREQCECYESMALPAGIDKDKIDATYRNGVLTVKFPKTQEGRAKRVTVKAK